MTHAEFTAAAPSTLCTLRWPDELPLNPLQNSCLVWAHAMPLEDVLRNVIRHLPLERGGEKSHRAALDGFVDGASAQEALPGGWGCP
ncbi:hypothetical protein ABTX71_30075 [Streptomyces parvulus]|uniref:hypothetical protein n=1 Tax=Streptomyces parvulus TaxID=146923 RepID=UPI003329BD9D